MELQKLSEFTWFSGPSSEEEFSSRVSWLEGGTSVEVKPKPDTDFWQRTHYGFKRDNGWCLLKKVDDEKDFVMSTHVTFHPKNQYDQAGLIVRVSEDFWVKTSVEFETPQEPQRLGCVVTNFGYSDWSTQDISNTLNDVHFRIKREGDDFTVEAATSRKGEGEELKWQQLRIAHLHSTSTLTSTSSSTREVQVGIYCCSPTLTGDGFSALFHNLKFQELERRKN